MRQENVAMKICRKTKHSIAGSVNLVILLAILQSSAGGAATTTPNQNPIMCCSKPKDHKCVTDNGSKVLIPAGAQISVRDCKPPTPAPPQAQTIQLLEKHK
jgi:hypothetical protein